MIWLLCYIWSWSNIVTICLFGRIDCTADDLLHLYSLRDNAGLLLWERQQSKSSYADSTGTLDQGKRHKYLLITNKSTLRHRATVLQPRRYSFIPFLDFFLPKRRSQHKSIFQSHFYSLIRSRSAHLIHLHQDLKLQAISQFWFFNHVLFIEPTLCSSSY